jgi:GDP-4-dehydro-6-deoxy-D-mannose reductase
MLPTPPTAPAEQSPRNLVTGVTGFAGCHLAAALVARGESVFGLSRRAAWPPAWAKLSSHVELAACDIGDAEALAAVLRRVRPTRIYHLAGFASVGASFRDPEAAWRDNLTATRRLCEAVARWGGRPRVLFVGSGLIYGQPEDDRPADEDTPLRPDTPYAASKAAADLACYQHFRAGLDVVRARPFNHIGPHQSPEFALPGWARQLVAIERGERPPVLETGDLQTGRDLTDVRDMAAAYALLMERGRAGEAYNIGTGQTHTMGDLLRRLIGLSGLRVEVRQRADLLRPTEQRVVRVDAAKVRRETGWRPRYALEQTLRDILAACRE